MNRYTTILATSGRVLWSGVEASTGHLLDNQDLMASQLLVHWDRQTGTYKQRAL